MWWEEVEREREVGGWEDGQGLDEDVGDGFVFGEVGVELVSKQACTYVSNISWDRDVFSGCGRSLSFR